jgi:membrane-associated protease RseP (regulator of RpoE activity)
MSEPIPPLASDDAAFGPPYEVVVVRPLRRRYWVHVLLLVLTIGTTLVVGAGMSYAFHHNRPPLDPDDNVYFPAFPLDWVWNQPARLLEGVPFSFSVLLILLSHEMGHYLYCVRYRVWATLPYFIPFPSLIGTMGAFIRIRSPIHTRSELFDIGIAGPIAGFVPAVIAAFVGISLSKPMPHFSQVPDIQFGHSLIFWVAQGISSWVSANPVLRMPLDRVYLHPVAVAAWVGMFATSLNLLPGGQLDGGHLVYSLAPRAHRWITILTSLILLPLAWRSWAGWAIWAVLVFLTGVRHPIVPLDPPLTRKQRMLALVALGILLVTFMPAPLLHQSIPEALRR